MTIMHDTPATLAAYLMAADAVLRYRTQSEGYPVPFTPIALPADIDSDVVLESWGDEDFGAEAVEPWPPMADEIGLGDRTPRLKRSVEIDPRDPMEDDINDFVGFTIV